MYGPDTIAAVFIEPIAGSTGTLVPPVGWVFSKPPCCCVLVEVWRKLLC
jgi:adenosylmethionine-8-amino-7-oxononanoate aminotransferase